MPQKPAERFFGHSLHVCYDLGIGRDTVSAPQSTAVSDGIALGAESGFQNRPSHDPRPREHLRRQPPRSSASCSGRPLPCNVLLRAAPVADRCALGTREEWKREAAAS